MGKFGKKLKMRSIKEWVNDYINYDELNKFIKNQSNLIN